MGSVRKTIFGMSLCILLISYAKAGQFGNPTVTWVYEVGTFGSRSSTPVVADIDDSSPGSEIIFNEDGEGTLCIASNGTLLWSNPSDCPSPSIGDLDNDGNAEIVGYDKCLNNDGTVKWSLPPGLPDMLHSAIANIDLVGEAEVLYTPPGLGGVYCLNSDGTLKWSSRTAVARANVAIANIDTVGTLEIIVPGDTLYCLNADGSVKWSYDGLGIDVRSPAIADINIDGKPEILLGCRLDGMFYCFDYEGQLRWSELLFTPGSFSHPPAIADLDGDATGYPEIVIFSEWDATMYAFRENAAGNGVDIVWAAEAVDSTWVDGPGPIICDIDGDGDRDVLWVGSRYLAIYNGPDGKHPDNSGAPFYRNDDFGSVTTHEHGVTVADIDGDFLPEVVALHDSGIAVLESDTWDSTGYYMRNQFSSYSYHITNINDDLSLPVPEPPHWLAGMHNTWLNQNWIEKPGTVEGEELVDQKAVLLLDYPNPFTQSCTIQYILPRKATISLKIYDISGRCTQILASGEKECGCYGVSLDGRKHPGGVYFARFVASGYKSTKKLVLMK